MVCFNGDRLTVTALWKHTQDARVERLVLLRTLRALFARNHNWYLRHRQLIISIIYSTIIYQSSE